MRCGRNRHPRLEPGPYDSVLRLAYLIEDARGVGIVRARLNRVRLGNFGDCKSVGSGVEELRIDFGPGYRIYFGREGSLVVIPLCGGSKRTQCRDLLRAQKYWQEYVDAKTTS